MRAILMFRNCEGQSHETVSTDHNFSASAGHQTRLVGTEVVRRKSPSLVSFRSGDLGICCDRPIFVSAVTLTPALLSPEG